MTRKTFDRLVSWIGLALAVLLIAAGSLLTWAHNFVHDEVPVAPVVTPGV